MARVQINGVLWQATLGTSWPQRFRLVEHAHEYFRVVDGATTQLNGDMVPVDANTDIIINYKVGLLRLRCGIFLNLS